jgi:hypothetical protein
VLSSCPCGPHTDRQAGQRATAQRVVLAELDGPGRRRREWQRDEADHAEKRELAELRWEKRRLELENEILKRAAVYFARENILPKQSSRWSTNSAPTESTSRWPAGS